MNRKTQQPTVRFKNPNVSSAEEKPEEADYVNAAVCPVEGDKKSPSFTQSVPTVAGCWLILLVIVALRIYFTSVISANNTKLTAKNQELETEKNNLTEQIKDLEMKNAVSVTQAQWSIDAYCPKKKEKEKEKEVRQCKACETGWGVFQSRCYAYHNPEPSKQRTWEEAREYCKGKISDLVTVADEEEKNHVSGLSVPSEGLTEYWIGLRAEGGKWKWFDGTNLADSLWKQTPVDGHCAVSVRNQGWKSVSCGERKRWICEKAALSL
ncbi:CD209 antigen isoform X31 [Lates calcarifer]|uniref:CD209 antigen isoform X30 n=1 Tax=Lates calcarifer TaxID=8187 RepID=A0AAJ8DUL9_LATCA|nr:CD209 antigen isoform X30 [Lates calcarifer]XP_050932112.1 CD209 antigen isoform X31 [Lates calcarifer]